MNDCKHIPFLLMFGDNGYNTPHALCLLVAYSSLQASLGYAKAVGNHHIAKYSSVTNVYVRVNHAPQFLVGFF
jgi:hypothetical protein